MTDDMEIERLARKLCQKRGWPPDERCFNPDVSDEVFSAWELFTEDARKILMKGPPLPFDTQEERHD